MSVAARVLLALATLSIAACLLIVVRTMKVMSRSIESLGNSLTEHQRNHPGGRP